MGDPLGIGIIFLASRSGNRTYPGTGSPRASPYSKKAAVALCIFGLMRQPLFFCFPCLCNALPIKKREEEKEKEEETKKYRENVRSMWIFSLI